jgi:ribosomal protein L11 methyltransferase
MNRLETHISISGRDLAGMEDEFEVVVANIVHDVLCTLADDLARVTSDDGFLVLSGILAGEQVASIRETFGARGFTWIKEVIEAEWSAVLLQKSA